MSDAELRKELLKLGFSPGPITDSTRGVYKKKLKNLKAGSARSQKNSKESERARKGQESTRSRRSEPIQNERQDWEEEEEDEDEESLPHRTNVSARQSRAVERNSYGGSSRVERGDDRFYFDSKSVTSPSHVGDTGPWKSDRSLLAGSNLTRGTAEHSDYLGYEHSSSLGGERNPKNTFEYGSSGQETRSSQFRERFPKTTVDYGSLGQEAKSFQEGERFPRTMFDYGSLGREAKSSQEVERFPRTTFDVGGQARFSSGGVRFTRNTAESSGVLGQDLRSRSTSERSSLSSLPLLRDEGRHRSRYEWDANDDHYPSRHPALSKPNWSRALEYYLSKLVRVLSVGLFIVFFGILIMKSGIFYNTQQDDIKLIPPDCEGKHDKYCQVMQKQIILQILSELYNFLSLEAGNFECGNPSGLSSKCIPIKKAKEHVLVSSSEDLSHCWLLGRDEHLGIWAKGEDGEIVTTSSLVFCVESSRPHLGISCRMINALYTAISNLFLALFGVFVLWLLLIYLRYHWRKLEEEEKQMFTMVGKIIDFVKHHYKDYQQGIEQNPYIGISHVRDMLIMPQDRKRLKKVWDRAVQFVEDNESRFRTESQRVAGADLLVWRWTQARSSLTLSTWGK
ncbi:PREDICTED: LEM domain-containing protein 2 [Nanorana parkeri]|uniref:LEM domain-containing protein 2 n=1 Tax=Nanorana parkeri TaxID=125878 RepID=UPI00085400E5|nr:PREDICTED: LEM domain-containing protein 2 [Nanorana parkeri]